MKTIYSYIFIATGIILLSGSCTRRADDRLDPNSNRLQINGINLISSTQWLTRAAGDTGAVPQPAVIYGNTVTSPDEYLTITAQKEQWIDAPSGDVPLTRGTPITTAAGIKELRLSIYATETSDWSASSPLTATITATNRGSGFSISPAYDWPTDPAKKTTIFAYAPLPTTKNGLVDLGQGQISYAMPSTVADQPDLCTAQPQMNIINNNGTEQQRTITLNHQLVAVGFTLKGYKATVNDIVLTNVKTGGKLTMNASGQATWSDMTTGTGHPTIITHTNEDQYSSDFSNITATDGYIMLPPQLLTDATVAVYYSTPTEIKEDGTIDIYDNKSFSTTLKALGIENWQAGDKITYNIECRTAPPITIEENLPYQAYYSRQLIATDVDPRDEILISWDADWLRMYKGNPALGAAPGGMKLNWEFLPGATYSGVHFIATSLNGSLDADRVATITIESTYSVPRKIRLIQRKRPTIEWLRTHIGASSLGISNAGETVDLPFKSNAPWKITSISPSGVTLSPTSGPATPETGIKLKVTIPSNPIGQGVRNIKITAQTTETGHEVLAAIEQGQYATETPDGILIGNLWWMKKDAVGQSGALWAAAPGYCVAPARLPTKADFENLLASGRDQEVFNVGVWDNPIWWTSTSKDSNIAYTFVGGNAGHGTINLGNKFTNYTRVRCVYDN